MDMSLSWEKEALESLVQSRHSKGLLLSYLLAPGTGNLCFEEVVSRSCRRTGRNNRGQGEVQVLAQQEPLLAGQALTRA